MRPACLGHRTRGTDETRGDTSPHVRSRLGAERSLVQIQSPRLQEGRWAVVIVGLRIAAPHRRPRTGEAGWRGAWWTPSSPATSSTTSTGQCSVSGRPVAGSRPFRAALRRPGSAPERDGAAGLKALAGGSIPGACFACLSGVVCGRSVACSLAQRLSALWWRAGLLLPRRRTSRRSRGLAPAHLGEMVGRRRLRL